MTEVQEKHPVKPEDLFKLKALQDAKLSPDGKSVVYCVGYTEGEKREQKAGLWLLDIESGESRRLTAGVKTDTSPAWSPDGKYIAFTAGPKMETPPDPSKPYRVTRNVYRFDGIGYLDPIVQDIYVVSSEGGEPGSMSEPRSFAEPKQLTHDPMMNTGPTWSPDGQEILFNAGFDPNESYPRSELKLVDLKGQVRTVVSGTWGMGNSGTFTPDGKQIVFTGSKKDKPFGGKNDLYVIKRHGSEPECRTNALNVGVGGGLQPDFPSMVGSKTCIPKDGASAFVNVQEGGTVQIYQVALHGEESWKVILDGERSVALTGMNAEKLLFVESSLLCPPELAIADIDGNNEKRLTSLNQQILDGIQFPKVEHLLYPGADGVQIEGWYFKPSFGEAPYPTILYIHGGPTGAFGHTFNFDFHLFAGAGYGVLFINPQGSCGYGDEYSTAINPDWGNKDYRDLMAGVDYVIEKGWADGDKLGVAGLSYGGYMSCWIVGQTGRFKAAIPENPVVDWLSMYGASDISAWLCETAFGGKPHEVPEIYRKTAPITYAHKATTPTLLIQGECDYRCPAIQSEEFYTTLKANGCIVEMIRVPGGSHIMSIGGDPNWRNMQNEEMLKWFDRYVKGITVA